MLYSNMNIVDIATKVVQHYGGWAAVPVAITWLGHITKSLMDGNGLAGAWRALLWGSAHAAKPQPKETNETSK